MAFTFRTNS